MTMPAFPYMARLKPHLPRVAIYLMLGTVLGYLLFYSVSPYYCAPFDAGMSLWQLVLILVGIGALMGYMYPDITSVMASAVVLPLTAAGFFFAIFLSPALSPDIVLGSTGDVLIIGARQLLTYLALSFIIIFSVGFMAMYLFESE